VLSKFEAKVEDNPPRGTALVGEYLVVTVVVMFVEVRDEDAGTLLGVDAIVCFELLEVEDPLVNFHEGKLEDKKERMVDLFLPSLFNERDTFFFGPLDTKAFKKAENQPIFLCFLFAAVT